jgi:hypothetical protein
MFGSYLCLAQRLHAHEVTMSEYHNGPMPSSPFVGLYIVAAMCAMKRPTLLLEYWIRDPWDVMVAQRDLYETERALRFCVRPQIHESRFTSWYGTRRATLVELTLLHLC